MKDHRFGLTGLRMGAVNLGVLSLVSNLLMLTGPLYMLQIYDRVLASRSIPTLLALTVLVMALYGFYALVESLRSRMTIRLGNAIDQRLNDRLFIAAIRLRVARQGRRVVDPLRDGEILRSFLSGAGPLAFLDVPWLPVYLIIIFAFHPMLGWLAVVGAVILLVLLFVNERVSEVPVSRSTEAASLRQKNAEDTLSNVESVIAMGMTDAVVLKNRRFSEESLQKHSEATDRGGFFTSSTKAIRFFLQSAVLAVGAYLVIQGEITAGVMIAASILMSRALAPVEQVVAHWKSFLASRQAVQRIRKILSVPVADDVHTLLDLPHETLAVSSLTVGQPGTQTALVTGVSFELAAGEALGIIGPSGSGKSSLAKSLVGVWPSMQGDVRFDGALLSQYAQSQIEGIIGYLPQRVNLLEGTIAENISRFSPQPSSIEVIEAAKMAGVHELILNLPDGYETYIENSGQPLSAGQQQRLGLARALYGRPFLIVLDEPNSNLDADGDLALAAAISNIKNSGSIVVVIAHRPSVMASVDKLLYISRGRQSAFGPKDEVLEKITERPPSNVRRMATR